MRVESLESERKFRVMSSEFRVKTILFEEFRSYSSYRSSDDTFLRLELFLTNILL